MISRKYRSPAYMTLPSLSCNMASSESTVPFSMRTILNASGTDKHGFMLYKIIPHQCRVHAVECPAIFTIMSVEPTPFEPVADAKQEPQS